MFCFHKYDKVQEDGYQYCKKCGKAEKAPHVHEWVEVEYGNIEQGASYYFRHGEWAVGKYTVMKCKKCGELEIHKVYVRS